VKRLQYNKKRKNAVKVANANAIRRAIPNFQWRKKVQKQDNVMKEARDGISRTRKYRLGEIRP
jgi:hypothetical protein